MIVGPTASGKSAVALELARRDPSIELVSVDSMQVYRGMDVGTAKPTPAEQAEVRHHLIDLVEPHEAFSVVDYQAAHDRAIADISARSARALLVGGTGLYVNAVVDRLTPPPQYPAVSATLAAEPDTAALHERLGELDPAAAARMQPSNRRRILRALEVTIGSGRPFSSYGPGVDRYPEVEHRLVGVDLDRDVLDERIDRRYEAQMAAGFLDEVRALLDRPQGWSHTAAQALGYKELAMHLRGELSLDEALDLAKRRTRRFARRQQRWFRRDPRITWLRHEGDPLTLVDQLAALT